MADQSQKEMLVQLVNDVSYIKDKQEKMKAKQDNMELAVHDVLIELTGTSADPNRGIIPRVLANEKCISTIKKRQFKALTWFTTLFTIFNTTAFILLIKYLKSIITGE